MTLTGVLWTQISEVGVGERKWDLSASLGLTRDKQKMCGPQHLADDSSVSFSLI